MKSVNTEAEKKSFNTLRDVAQYIWAMTGVHASEAELQYALETGEAIGGFQIALEYPGPDAAEPVKARRRDPLIRWPPGEAPLNRGIPRRWS